jgi:peptide/nickel transport system substrate-binding protein
MHGEPALPPGFTHFPYANPDAPQGGRITLGASDTFNSLNPLIIRGVVPEQINSLVYERLLARNANEPFSLYGLIAEAIELPDDRSSITFHINPKAHFSDGVAITPEDVIFSWRLLKDTGRQYMRSYYTKVARAEKLGSATVKFTFASGSDREMPLILGRMPVLPRHLIENTADFNRPSLHIPVGSGPYRITKVDPGQSIVFERDPNYWARDLPTRRGLFNFEQIRYLYFNDQTPLFEAFKSGLIDFRNERDPGRWVSGYDFPALHEGRIKRYVFPSHLPAGMTGLVFNTRRRKFNDPRVRRAFIHAFDGRRINRQLFHDRYERSQSYFAGSELASTGLRASARERELLAPFSDAVKPAIMDGTWRVPSSGKSSGGRKNLRQAYDLLRQAGYRVRDGRMVDVRTGEQLAVEFLVLSRAQARIVTDYAENLKRLGIAAAIRQVEGSQYWARLQKFDFDIIQWSYTASLSPGNEQIHRWTSAYANAQGSLNFAGVKNKAVDAMIEAMLKMRSRSDFVAAVRAFDRILLSGDYVVPLFHLPNVWVAASTRLAFPETRPLGGIDLNTWWVKPGH